MSLNSEEKRSRTSSVCDLEFANDIFLLSNEIEHAKMLLHSARVECSKVGLGIKDKKTKGMTFNVDFEMIHNVT